MNTTNRKELDLGIKKDTFMCVALLVTAITILISGAISVHHQNALQAQQPESVARGA